MEAPGQATGTKTRDLSVRGNYYTRLKMAHNVISPAPEFNSLTEKLQRMKFALSALALSNRTFCGGGHVLYLCSPIPRALAPRGYGALKCG